MTDQRPFADIACMAPPKHLFSNSSELDGGSFGANGGSFVNSVNSGSFASVSFQAQQFGDVEGFDETKCLEDFLGSKVGSSKEENDAAQCLTSVTRSVVFSPVSGNLHGVKRHHLSSSNGDENQEISTDDHPPFVIDAEDLMSASLQIVQTIGEGAFGEVKHLMDSNNPRFSVAVKLVDLNVHKVQRDAIKRESLLQQCASATGHINILRFIHSAITPKNEFQLFMEYIDGGELFDHIVPDEGMAVDKAKGFFMQLLDGLEHIHSLGICHRDIKPENLLLTRQNVLKIADFGMATLFRHNGVERMMQTRCGSLPYAAPEVFHGSYRGSPIDVWSSGIVLTAMLVGQFPWDAPQFRWLNNDNVLNLSTWKCMNTSAFSLLKSILNANPNQRATIERIRAHPWITLKSDLLEKEPMPKLPRLMQLSRLAAPSSQPCSMVSLARTEEHDVACLFSANEIDTTSVDTITPEKTLRLPLQKRSSKSSFGSFSQPFIGSQSLLTQSQTLVMNQPIDCSWALRMGPLQKMARRMTRFCVLVPAIEALLLIKNLLIKKGFETKHPLHYQAIVVNVYDMVDEGKSRVLVDFRRSNGDGLTFKRMFACIRHMLRKVIEPCGDQWLRQRGLLCAAAASPVRVDQQAEGIQQRLNVSSPQFPQTSHQCNLPIAEELE